jgi:hypothetical protein
MIRLYGCRRLPLQTAPAATQEGVIVFVSDEDQACLDGVFNLLGRAHGCDERELQHMVVRSLIRRVATVDRRTPTTVLADYGPAVEMVRDVIDQYVRLTRPC